MQKAQLLVDRIRALARERNAVILAHNYQIGSVQDIADYVGDSLELARAAASTQADTIVFCGVNFMAETAAILSPGRTVLLPAGDACCPMADMITAEELKSTKNRFPEAAVVCYVNTTAEVKAESDICCTSANAVKVVESVRAEQVIFIPDQNLARYVARFTKKEILPWEGFCIVHDRFTREEVLIREKPAPGCRSDCPSRVPARGDRPRGSCTQHIRHDPARVRFPGERVYYRDRGGYSSPDAPGVPRKKMLSPFTGGYLCEYEEDHA